MFEGGWKVSSSLHRVALITGASRNIGALLAKRLAAGGTKVILVGRSEDLLVEVNEEIERAGGVSLHIVADVGSADEITRIAALAKERFGRVDILVNNAVSRLHKAFLATTDQEIETVLDVSLWSSMRLSRALLPDMVEAGWGRIVNMVGTSAQSGASGRAPYLAAKSGLIGLTKALGIEFAAVGVTVNAVSPGTVDTERGTWTLAGQDEQEMRDWYAKRAQEIPANRFGEMGEICSAIEFLVSDGASYITGHVLNVTGGSYT
jgi:NAD(P)-dependent dehydrogenase (short-subunit alcohol dehydrogenase family)